MFTCVIKSWSVKYSKNSVSKICKTISMLKYDKSIAGNCIHKITETLKLKNIRCHILNFLKFPR